MTMKNVKSSLDKISKNLSELQDAREYLLKNTREIVILCSQAIMLTHRNELKQAEKKLVKAQKLLKKHKEKVSIEIQRYFITAEQEYVEAVSLMSIVEKKEIPSKKEMSVMQESYVLGLMDCVGELKRMILDKIRVNDLEEATRIFDIMENLHLSLYTFAMYDKVIKEARKKIDVGRILVDDVRSVITEEKRRAGLIKTINELKDR